MTDARKYDFNNPEIEIGVLFTRTQLPLHKNAILPPVLIFSQTENSTMVASDETREVALTLAQDNLDDDAAEESVSHAMWLIKEAAAREELSGPLSLEVGEFAAF